MELPKSEVHNAGDYRTSASRWYGGVSRVTGTTAGKQAYLSSELTIAPELAANTTALYLSPAPDLTRTATTTHRFTTASTAPPCLTTTISCKTRAERRSMCAGLSQWAEADHGRYDFEYEDDDEEQSGDVDIENKYYSAKQLKGDDPEAAVDEFLGIPALEEEKSDWGFKGLKQAIKLEFKLARYDQVCSAAWASCAVANRSQGHRALQGAPHLRQVGRHAQLLGKVHQQHARLY
jgi:hypothetical protein